MKKHEGFTLIELVVVIIILAILAVTALPKFINLQGDARASTLEGVKGALESASTLTYSKAVIDSMQKFSVDENQLSGYTVDGIEISYGYPIMGLTSKNFLNLREAAGLNVDDWDIRLITKDNISTVYIEHKDNDTWSCYVTYQQPQAIGEKPIITIETEDC
ncbi:MAG: type II secretion system protein [Colwellia sp.]